jgi:hypothetical protein
MPYIYNVDKAIEAYSATELNQCAAVSPWVFEEVALALSTITERMGCNSETECQTRMQKTYDLLQGCFATTPQEYATKVMIPISKKMRELMQIETDENTKEGMIWNAISAALGVIRSYTATPHKTGILDKHERDREVLSGKGKSPDWFDAEMAKYVRDHIQEVIGELDAAIQVNKQKQAPFVNTTEQAQKRTEASNGLFQSFVRMLGLGSASSSPAKGKER